MSHASDASDASDASLPPWPDFGPVLMPLRQALNNNNNSNTVVVPSEIREALDKLLDGRDVTTAAPFFDSAGLPMQRALQHLHQDARHVAPAYVRLPADVAERIASLKAEAGHDEDKIRAALLAERQAREDAADDLVAKWLDRMAAAVHAAMTEIAQRRAEREAANKDAPAIYAKLKKQAIPQVSELRETLRKLCDAMRRAGHGMDASFLSGEHVGALDKLERALLRLPASKKG